MASKLIIEIQPDGTLKTNARQMVGAEADILAVLEELAATVGGELTVEKHEPGNHSHSHGDGHTHDHGSLFFRGGHNH